LSGTSPSTCPAWETLPVATAGLALGFIGTRKPHHHYDKVKLKIHFKFYLKSAVMSPDKGTQNVHVRNVNEHRHTCKNNESDLNADISYNNNNYYCSYSCLQREYLFIAVTIAGEDYVTIFLTI
jgi:hypothetical protein